MVLMPYIIDFWSIFHVFAIVSLKSIPLGGLSRLTLHTVFAVVDLVLNINYTFEIPLNTR